MVDGGQSMKRWRGMRRYGWCSMVAACLTLVASTGSAAASTAAGVVGPPLFFPTQPGGPDLFLSQVSFGYEAALGEANLLQATRTATGWRLTDPGATITLTSCSVSPDGHQPTAGAWARSSVGDREHRHGRRQPHRQS
jgi:hypothetical protein